MCRERSCATSRGRWPTCQPRSSSGMPMPSHSRLQASVPMWSMYICIGRFTPASDVRVWPLQAGNVAVEFRGADFDWKHTGWTQSAANRSLVAAAAQTLDPAAPPRSGTASFHRRRRRLKRRSVADADSPPESPSEPLLKGLRFSVHRGELLGICGEVRWSLAQQPDITGRPSGDHGCSMHYHCYVGVVRNTGSFAEMYFESVRKSWTGGIREKLNPGGIARRASALSKRCHRGQRRGRQTSHARTRCLLQSGRLGCRRHNQGAP